RAECLTVPVSSSIPSASPTSAGVCARTTPITSSTAARMPAIPSRNLVKTRRFLQFLDGALELLQLFAQVAYAVAERLPRLVRPAQRVARQGQLFLHPGQAFFHGGKAFQKFGRAFPLIFQLNVQGGDVVFQLFQAGF